MNVKLSGNLSQNASILYEKLLSNIIYTLEHHAQREF